MDLLNRYRFNDNKNHDKNHPKIKTERELGLGETEKTNEGERTD